MKVQYWGWKLVVFVILSVILCVVYFRVEVKAEDVAVSTVRIMIGEGTEARHHMGLAMDAVSDEFRFEVKGYEFKIPARADAGYRQFHRVRDMSRLQFVPKTERN